MLYLVRTIYGVVHIVLSNVRCCQWYIFSEEGRTLPCIFWPLVFQGKFITQYVVSTILGVSYWSAYNVIPCI